MSYQPIQTRYEITSSNAGLAAIQDAPIRELYVSNIHIDEKFGELLSARANTLESLTILNARPFGPDFLKPLRSLKRFTIPGDLGCLDPICG
ncbi:hypothetical protein LMANV2_90072 [Leptospira interrogans serovar Manilae]|uniref:Uncharacterized protein n=1 Tax=Leptospira interrogans serovar Manilae TaxID=214675 RepID=A0AAQ1P1N6_LEPIR|nr:hypothetical protein LIMLP_19180 [Leptospira interrogans serovar Manilae]AKP31933.1 hypothetical protein LIMHP_19185 [Leptospira interrogans serovar Manilae]EYU63962.1 hypothetical protein CI00_10740 [Leptospira interrogans serovar Manilae]SOR63878.1 hypothetical protein LMANV2_90072 [Leptospira interrogans serovar Manilae]